MVGHLTFPDRSSNNMMPIKMETMTMKRLMDLFVHHRSSAYPWTFVESLIKGNRQRDEFDQVRSYVMFIGQPRSGTSLVGSLLNAHPQMWIAQELNALRYVARGYGRNQLYWLLRMRDREFDQNGRLWTGYDYVVENQWQGRCEQMLVIGDKKAGLSSELLGQQPELMNRLQQLVQVPVRIFHIVRNPFNVITTIHRKRSRTPLPMAIQMYFGRCRTNWRLMQDSSLNIMTLRLEDLIASPLSLLREMCRHVGLDADDAYLEACADKLFDKPRQSQTEIKWTNELVNSVYDQMQRYPFLEGYEFSGQVAANAA